MPIELINRGNYSKEQAAASTEQWEPRSLLTATFSSYREF